MKKHVKAFTYAPKIPAVRSGECRQTIRPGGKVWVGDEILWHGWVSRPYRSKWSWRQRVVVTESIPILVDEKYGIGKFKENDTGVFMWNDWNCDYVNDLAKKDFIDPPTGIGLRDVLLNINGSMDFLECQIIRW